MSREAQGKLKVPSAADCAEAAAWIAKLHGEERNPQLEAGLRRWLASSDAHRAAFEMANDLWVETTRLPKSDYPIRLAPERAITLTWPRLATAAAIVLGLAFVGSRWLSHDAAIATEVGELRNIALDDGTRVTLNTASRLKVHYSAQMRAVELEQGEAFFDVAKRADRPFVVMASGKRITALGTSFVVRRDSDAVAVTLLDGKVAVSGEGAEAQVVQPNARAVGSLENTSAHGIVMSPGQRMIFENHKSPATDRPRLEQLTAWQRGQIVLDRTSLADAVAEMNRYSVKQLVIDSEQARNMRVTGVFRAGDSEDFARAVAESYGLALQEDSATIVLAGIPTLK